MKYFAYQGKAVEQLTEKTIGLLNEGGSRRKIIFEAPTGSGKTIMACQAIANIVDSLKADGANKYEEAAFIWFAPRKLHIQSYMKLKGAFEDGRELHPVMFDELDQSKGIQSGEILFVNWESINREDNRMVQDGESSASIFEICRLTKEEKHLPIVAIIDEEHMFWSKTADKTAAVLDRINPSVEIRISATPKTTKFDEKVRVSRKDVIDAEMIKREVVLNPDIKETSSDETTLNNALMKAALAKRKQIAEAYSQLGVNINPLLLIQLPNDKDTMTAEDIAIASFVKQYLDAMAGINVENGKLAIWLANEKDNLAGLEKENSLVEVLLFKEAIALGWDCPRSAVLLIFRKLQSNEFTIQTVGRIMRMPEQHHYADDRLNVGYVYTDIAKDKIKVIPQDADYVKKTAIVAVRREHLKNIELQSYYSERPNDARNYFGPDFRKVLFEESEAFWGIEYESGSLFSLAELAALRTDDDVPASLPESNDEQVNENRSKVAARLKLDVKTVNIEIPSNVHFQNEVQTIDISGQQVKFARTASEIDRVYLSFISGYVRDFESKNNPTDKLAGYVLEMLEDYFGLFDTDAKKVVLYHDNKPLFDRLLKLSIEKYKKLREAKRKSALKRAIKDFTWSVPEDRLYDEETHHIAEARNHGLVPYVEFNDASTPEKEFTAFIEGNTEHIDWWYKNGDKGRQHYAIPYKRGDDSIGMFYVDFVIRLKNGKVFLFDTKSSGSDMFGTEKHNALIDYIAAHKEVAGGGVIIKDGMNWLWSRFKIEDTVNHEGWDYFDPRRENQ